MRRVAIVLCLTAFALALVATGGEDLRSLAIAQEATPGADCPESSEEEDEATARRWFEEAINGADLTVLDEIAAVNVVHHAGTLPDGQGLDAIKRVLGVLLAGFPDARHTIDQVIAKDDVVVVRWRAEGTQEGEFQGFAPTGQPVTWTGINIFRFECGKIAESWSEVDGIGRLTRLGLIATPTP